MLGNKPLTVDFEALLGPKINLEKLAGIETKDVKTEEADKTAGVARLMTSPAIKIRKSGIGTKVRNKTSFNHLTKNKRVDPNESLVTRAAKKLGASDFWTKAR